MAVYPLRQLEAQFIKYVPVMEAYLRHTFHPVESVAEADGIHFICPKCFATDGHSVQVYFAGKSVPPELGKNSKGETVRWHASGNGLDDLVLTPSIQVEAGCMWHGFVGSSGIPPGHAG